MAVSPRGGHDREVTGRAMVSRWLAGYEAAWRLPSCPDVGRGTGALTRSLRSVIPQVTGIDRDEQSIAMARTHPQARDIAYRHEDFLTAVSGRDPSG